MSVDAGGASPASATAPIDKSVTVASRKRPQAAPKHAAAVTSKKAQPSAAQRQAQAAKEAKAAKDAAWDARVLAFYAQYDGQRVPPSDALRIAHLYSKKPDACESTANALSLVTLLSNVRALPSHRPSRCRSHHLSRCRSHPHNPASEQEDAQEVRSGPQHNL